MIPKTQRNTIDEELFLKIDQFRSTLLDGVPQQGYLGPFSNCRQNFQMDFQESSSKNDSINNAIGSKEHTKGNDFKIQRI